MSHELLARLRQLEDREAIRDLHNQYCFILDAAGDLGEQAFVAAGYYEDEYVRTARGWKFILHRVR